MADTVLIACKAPNGLVLNLDRSEKTDERGGSRIIRGAMTVTLAGWSHAFNEPDPTRGQGGYAFTQVPTEFWDEWFKINADSSFIADKIILPPHRDMRSQAMAHAEVPKMFGPADVKDVGGVKKLETEAV
jgi:hypothetical protein